MIGAVFSISPNGGMGYKNKLLYYDPEDMKLFKENTKDKVVILMYISLVEQGLLIGIRMICSSCMYLFSTKKNKQTPFFPHST